MAEIVHLVEGSEHHRFHTENLVIEVVINGDEFVVAVRAPRVGTVLDAAMHERNDWNREVRGRVAVRSWKRS